MTTNDPRRGLPSASMFHRLVACPGSLRFSRDLEERGELPPEEESAMAESGTAIHAELARRMTPGAEPGEPLKPEETAVAEECVALIDAALMGIGVSRTELTIHTEERLWLRDELRPIISGQYDFLGITDDGETAVLADFKSGWGEHEEAAANWQLRLLAVLVWRVYGPKKLFASLIQPNAPRDRRRTLTLYTQPAIRLAETEIREVLRRAQESTAPLFSGPHCRWCPARAKCAVHAATQTAIATVDPRAIQAEDMPRLLHAAKAAQIVANAILAEGRRILIDDPESDSAAILGRAGWKLKPGRKTREITDPGAAFNLLAERGMPTDAILEACTIQIGKAEKAFAAHAQQSAALAGNKLTIKAAKEEFAEAISGVVRTSQGAPVLDWQQQDQEAQHA